MTTLYYLLSIFFIWIELQWVIFPMERVKDSKRFHEMSKENKGKKWNEFPEEYKSQIKSKMWLIIIPLWDYLLFNGLGF